MPAIAALPGLDDLRDRALASLASCGVSAGALSGDQRSRTPILGAELARVSWCTAQDAGNAVDRAQQAFRTWRQVPARPAAPSSSGSPGCWPGIRRRSPP